MSRMSKYLNQKCTYEKMKRKEDGSVSLDKFGEPSHEAPIVIKCRFETSIQEVQTNTGVVLTSSVRFFTDDKHSIQVGDKLGGKSVIKVQEYINQFGDAEGFESYV